RSVLRPAGVRSGPGQRLRGRPDRRAHRCRRGGIGAGGRPCRQLVQHRQRARDRDLVQRCRGTGGPRSRAGRDDGGLPGGLRRCGRHRPARRRAGLALVPAASAGRQLRCRARARARYRAAGGTVKVEAQDLAGTELWASPQWRSAATAWLDEQLSATWPRAWARSPSRLRRWAAILTAATCVLSWTDSAERKTMATGPLPTAGATSAANPRHREPVRPRYWRSPGLLHGLPRTEC